MPDQYQANIRSFYEYIQSQGGVRYGHQFIVKLNVGEIPGAAFNARGYNRDTFIEMMGRDWFKYLKEPNPTDPTKDLTFFAQGTSIPQTQLVTTDVSFLAAGFKLPGVMKYDDSWTIEILLDQNLYLYTELLYWKQLMSSYSRNSGGNKTIPDIDGDILLLDNYMDRIERRFKVRGIFIKELAQVKLQYKQGGSAEQKCQATFAMQWFEQVDVKNGQPLWFDGIG